jgi:predicted PurR-regulated permease PerM
MISLIDLRTARVIVTILLFAVVLSFLYAARQTLMAFLFAIFFAYLMDPAVSRVERLVRSRARAVAVIYLLLVLTLGTFLFFVGPQIGRQAQHLGASIPPLLRNIGSGNIANDIGFERGWSYETRDQVKVFLASHRDTMAGLAQSAGVKVAEVAKQAWLLVLIPILAAFFLNDGRQFGEVVLTFAGPRPQREFVEGVLQDLNQMLAQFIRAQLTLAGLSMVAYSSFMGAMRVPNSLVLGIAGGMMEFIPVVGPLVAGVVIVGVSLIEGYPHWFILLIFLGVWRIVQDYVVSPRIMGKSMELHPLAAIFGVLAGAEIGGVLGIYLSIPVMASLRIVWRRWRLYAEKRRFGPLNEYIFGEPAGRKLPG